MNIETTFFKATDGVDLKGVIYKTQNKTNKVLISIHGMATNCIKERDEKIAEKVPEVAQKAKELVDKWVAEYQK